MALPQMHGRTHCPTTGTDPIPIDCFPAGVFPWVRLGQYSRSVSDSTWTRVPFRFAAYDSAITTLGTDFTLTEISDGLGHNIWQVTSRKEGFYFYDLQVGWDTTGAALVNDAAQVGLRVTNAVNSIDHLYDGSDWFASTTFASGSQGELEEANGKNRLSGIVYVSSANQAWIPQCIQTTGGSRTVGGDYFYLVRLMTTNGLSWTTLTST